MMTKIKFTKILLAMILCVGYFSPSSVFAAGKIQTQFNPLCWTEKECSDKRAELWGEERATGGWLEKEGEECNKTGWGKCLAGNVTKTEVSFGGKTQFSNIGEYIKTIYNYGLVVIGILAVVVLIIAGAQWITSAGSAEVITQSKKRISGAIIGLFIAYMSFIILKSINPATVNLRLPQIYLIKAQVLASKWCREVPKSGGLEAVFSYAADSNKQSDKVEATGSESPMSYEKTAAPQFWCGQRFFVQGAAPDVTCLGDRCNKGQVCSDIDPVDKKNPFACLAASIAGEITGLESSYIEGVTSDNSWESIDPDAVELHLVCNDGAWGTTVKVDIDYNVSDEENGKQSYVIKAAPDDLNDAVQECGGAGKVVGAYMFMEFTPNASTNYTDENHIIGAQGSTGVDMIYFMFGQDPPVEAVPGIWRDELWIPLSSVQNGTQVNIKAGDVYRAEQAGTSIGIAWDVVSNLKLTDLNHNVNVLNQAVDTMAKSMLGHYKPVLKPEYAKYLLWWEK